QGPPIPTSSVVKPIPKVTKDQVHPSCSQSTAPVQPPVGPEPITTPVFEPIVAPIVAPVVAPVPNTKPSVSLPYPSRRDNEKSRNQANEQIDKFYEIFKEMSFEISFADRSISKPMGIAKDISVKVSVFHFPADFVVVDKRLRANVANHIRNQR
ncbi:hypothetical protein Tco_1207552, partial [Tanacetum coccineum]